MTVYQEPEEPLERIAGIDTPVFCLGYEKNTCTDKAVMLLKECVLVEARQIYSLEEGV